MSSVPIVELMESSGVKFGTSGARGLVSALSDRVAYAYASGFLAYLEGRGELGQRSLVAIGGDRRSSTERILRAVARAVADRGHRVVHAGRLPSPALMLYGISNSIPSIMVTGSHIPDDRNGIKFNSPRGEILKSDEGGILGQVVILPDIFEANGSLRAEANAPLPAVDPEPSRGYYKRWLQAFPSRMLAGRRIGIYGHSAVGRDLLVEIVSGLGAEAVPLGWSEQFISVDTEAIRPEDVTLARGWAREQSLFGILSTDGDSDRPLIADEHGHFFRGDVAGVLAARFFDASFVVAPVSCNTVLEKCGWFRSQRTRIGSPYVIETMLRAVQDGEPRVVGYEANGGFLTATELAVPGGGKLSALPTRDPVIVHLALLGIAVQKNLPLSALPKELPPRFTASDRIAELPTQVSARYLENLRQSGKRAMEQEFPALGPIADYDEVDGLRMTFASAEIVHVRPSGNAPELRCYVEADSEARAAELLTYGLGRLGTLREAG